MRKLSLLAALPAAALAIGMALAPAAGAVTVTPSITVTPSTNLTDGSTVTVAGTGFPADSPLYVLQCSKADPNACDTSNLGGAMTTATGTFTTTLTVHTGAIGNGSCKPGSSNCLIVASTADAKSKAAAPISFKTVPMLKANPASGLSNGTQVTVTASGYPASSPVFVVECSGATQSACDTTNLVSVVTSAKGAFTTKFTVHTGTIGNGTCKAGSSNCLIVASTADASAKAAQPIAFKAVPTKTVASYATKTHTLAVTVSAAGKGVKGLTTGLLHKVGKKWTAVKTLKTGTGGKATYKVTKSGSYMFSTPKQGQYAASVSKIITAKV